MNNVTFNDKEELTVTYVKVTDDVKSLSYWVHPFNLKIIDSIQSMEKMVSGREPAYVRAYTVDGKREINLLLSLGTPRYTYEKQ